MNVYDSQRMADALAPEGYRRDRDARGRRPVILNTCHIREKAAEKVYSELGRMRVLKAGRGARGPRRDDRASPAASRRPRARRSSAARRRSISWSARRAITACPTCSRAPRSGEQVGRDRVPGRGQVRPSRRRRAARRRARAASPPSSPCRKAATSSAPSASCPTRAAPRCRGRSRRSSPRRERLADAGVREVTLLGQNVNAYHGEGPDGRAWTLGRLLRRLAEVPGIARLRYTTSHPRDMDDDLIAAHRDLPQLMPYLHLPVQSGSDRILDGDEPPPHRAPTICALIERHPRRAARHRALVAISSSAFPGETEADFARHAARWSTRSATPAPSRSSIRRGPARPAPTMADQVAEDGEGRAAAAPAGR